MSHAWAITFGVGTELAIVAAFLLPKATAGANFNCEVVVRALLCWGRGTLGLWERGRKETLELLHSTLVPVGPLVRYSICHADRDRL